MDIGKKRSEEPLSGTERFRVFRYLDKANSYVETVLNVIGVVFILILMLFTASEIIGRYLFVYPIPGYVEDVELIMAAIVFLGIGYTQRVGAHIRMDIVISMIKGRFCNIAEAISLLLALVGFAIICMSSFEATLDAYRMGDVTEYLYTPTWPSKLCVPIGSFFLCIRFIIQIVSNIAQAVVGPDVREAG
ncbi:MAG: TRAP transporter small permease [Deltaproteobacteria bacterium]|nr:TRAP transporter small permease [Deltaproteobacteria bacterium]